MKKMIVFLILLMMSTTAVASDYNIQDLRALQKSQLSWVADWFDYCYDIDETGEVYLCQISALDVMADYYYMCWLD